MDICDFCSSPDVVKRFQCLDFVSESADAGVLYAKPEGPTNLLFKSTSYWAACAPCARLVEAEDLDGLLHRVTLEFRKRGYWVDLPLQLHLYYTYQLFFKNRLRVKEPSS